MQEIIDNLTKRGYAQFQFFNDDELAPMQRWANTLPLKKANITKGNNYRGDETYWLDPLINDVDLALYNRLFKFQNRLLNHHEYYMLKTDDIEAHIAHYPPGTCYGKHLDATKRNNKRILSLVAYFNPGWVPQHGGQLRLYTDNGMVDIPPFHGTGVIFLSEEIEHEVLETKVDRWSLAAWFRK
jgi:SM-20-related protein